MHGLAIGPPIALAIFETCGEFGLCRIPDSHLLSLASLANFSGMSVTSKKTAGCSSPKTVFFAELHAAIMMFVLFVFTCPVHFHTAGFTDMSGTQKASSPSSVTLRSTSCEPKKVFVRPGIDQAIGSTGTRVLRRDTTGKEVSECRDRSVERSAVGVGAGSGRDALKISIVCASVIATN